MPTIQDPRVEESVEAEDIEAFFIAIAANSNEEVQEFLELEPSLIYARDEHGSTPIRCAVGGSGRESDLETVRILMNYNPDLTMTDNHGWTVFTALQGIRDPLLMRQFAHLLDPTIQFEDYAVVEARATAAVTARNAAVDPLAAADAYFNRSDVSQALSTSNQITGNVVSYNMQEVRYNQDLSNIFKNLPVLNTDEQKKIDQTVFNAENSLLKSLSFFPADFESVSENPLSIIIIPKELLEFSFEQLSNMFGEMYNYLSGTGQ